MNPIREDLKAFVDGELSETRMEEVRQAVESDPAIKQEVEELKLLGFEIKRMASEPAVVGKEAVLDKIRRPKAPWWDASRLSGRLAYSCGLFLVLAGVGAVLFPVFAQSKSDAAGEAATFRNADVAAGASKMPSTEGFGGVGGGGADARANPSLDEAKPEENTRLNQAGGFPSDVPAAKPPAAGKERTLMDSGALSGEVTAEWESPANAPAATTTPDRERGGRLSRRSTPQTSARANTNTPVPNVAPTRRMVVKNADISLKVEDAKEALTEAEALAKSLGGYSEGGNLTSMEGQTPHSSCVLRVKSDMYETAMKALRGMGEVLSETSNANDVTAEHADTVGRLGVLRAEADSYVTMLRGARRIGEIMEIKDRLSNVRQEIASLETQRKALANESALSTIRATFTQKESVDKKKTPEKSGFDETWAKAQNGLSNVGEFLGNLMIYIFVFSPVWLPPVLLFWWLSKKARA